MKAKPAKVEFYPSNHWPQEGVGPPVHGYAWRLRAPNGKIICTPHETFVSRSNAVRSFKTVADALDMRAVIEVDGSDVDKPKFHRLLVS